jgi:hypothetical protein
MQMTGDVEFDSGFGMTQHARDNYHWDTVPEVLTLQV